MSRDAAASQEPAPAARIRRRWLRATLPSHTTNSRQIARGRTGTLRRQIRGWWRPSRPTSSRRSQRHARATRPDLSVVRLPRRWPRRAAMATIVPAGRATAGRAAAAPASPDVAQLARLLHLSAGVVRPATPRRPPPPDWTRSFCVASRLALWTDRLRSRAPRSSGRWWPARGVAQSLISSLCTPSTASSPDVPVAPAGAWRLSPSASALRA